MIDKNTGVSLGLVIVLVGGFWALNANFSDFKEKQSADNQVVKDAVTELDHKVNIMNINVTQELKEAAKERQALREAMKERTAMRWTRLDEINSAEKNQLKNPDVDFDIPHMVKD